MCEGTAFHVMKFSMVLEMRGRNQSERQMLYNTIKLIHWCPREENRQSSGAA